MSAVQFALYNSRMGYLGAALYRDREHALLALKEFTEAGPSVSDYDCVVAVAPVDAPQPIAKAVNP